MTPTSSRGSGICWLREDELDPREFARVGNPLALRAAARVGNAGSQDGRVRPPRISEGRESAGSGLILPATLPHACGIVPVGSAYRRTKSNKNIPQMAPNEEVGFQGTVEYAL